MGFLDCLQMLGVVRPVQRPPSPEQWELAAVDFDRRLQLGGWAWELGLLLLRLWELGETSCSRCKASLCCFCCS